MDRAWYRSSPKRRLDSNFGNLTVLLGLMIPSLAILLQGPTPRSALNDMPEFLQTMMCICIFFGCGVKLHGALAGRRFYFPNVSLKRCYQFGYTGAPSATVGCLVYGWFIATGTDQFWSAVSGVATPLFGIGISLQAFVYWLESRRIETNEIALRRIHRMNEENVDEC